MTEPKETAPTKIIHPRQPSDNYATPFEIAKWSVDHCLQLSDKHCGKPATKLRMLEPGCGDNAPFSRYAASIGMEAHAVDMRNVQKRETVLVLNNTSFLDMPSERTKILYAGKYDVIATNPPFIYGIEFVQRSLDMLSERGVALFLMKLSFVGSQSRCQFFQTRPPSEVHVLSRRPSFAYGGKTDKGQEYGLFVWNGREVDAKVRAKYGRITRMFWHENREWPVPVLPDGNGKRIQVEKFEPEEQA